MNPVISSVVTGAIHNMLVCDLGYDFASSVFDCQAVPTVVVYPTVVSSPVSIFGQSCPALCRALHLL